MFKAKKIRPSEKDIARFFATLGLATEEERRKILPPEVPNFSADPIGKRCIVKFSDKTESYSSD
jgi:hypothetical protein